MSQLVPISQKVAIHPKIQITPNSLSVTSELSKEEFIEAYNTLERIEGANSWWKGDLARQHKIKKGDLKELADNNGWNLDALYVYKSIAETYETLTRIKVLSFKHHQFVASRPDRMEWLQRAADGEDGKPWPSSFRRATSESQIWGFYCPCPTHNTRTLSQRPQVLPWLPS